MELERLILLFVVEVCVVEVDRSLDEQLFLLQYVPLLSVEALVQVELDLSLVALLLLRLVPSLPQNRFHLGAIRKYWLVWTSLNVCFVCYLMDDGLDYMHIFFKKMIQKDEL